MLLAPFARRRGLSSLHCRRGLDVFHRGRGLGVRCFLRYLPYLRPASLLR
jgi:hypothetical protein